MKIGDSVGLENQTDQQKTWKKNHKTDRSDDGKEENNGDGREEDKEARTSLKLTNL